MTRHVALLGGINVGGHRVTMDRLRTEVTALGHTDVSTFIASGNVLFTTTGRTRPDAIEARLQQHLEAQLGWPVPTYLRSAAEVIAAADLLPFGPVAEGCTHMVVFCRATPAADRVAVLATAHDRFHVDGREVHWLIQGKLTSSAITLPALVKAIGPNTTRNVTTVTKLAALLRS